MKLDGIHESVQTFERKRSARMSLLRDDIEKSKSNTYGKRKYSWREQYDTIMKRKRQEE